MAFSWATDPGAEVTEPSTSRKSLGYKSRVGGTPGDKPPAGEFNWLFQQVAQMSSLVGITLQASGPLASMAGRDADWVYLPNGMTISSIAVSCPQTPASGTITIDILTCAAGGTMASLYSVRAKPAITCNGGYAGTTQSGVTLPETVTIPSGNFVSFQIVSAPAEAYDAKVQVN